MDFMEDFDESEMINSAEYQEDPDRATLKFLKGGYTRLATTTANLAATTADLSNRVGSVESTMVAIERTLLQISNQLGKRPIAAESSRQVPPVTHSETYVRDDLNRLPLDNRKSLLRKIEMPKFDGSNAYDWFSKVERFFRVGRYSDLDKLDLVALSLEGDVLKWFNWEVCRREFQSWEEFRRRLFRRFGAAPEQSPGNRLFALKQTGTVSAYVTEFEELSAQVVGLDELHLEQIFYNGLKTEMREVLKLKEPVGLENQKNAVLRMETSSFCQILSDEPTKSWGSPKPFTSKPVTTYTQPRPLMLQNGEGQGAGQIVAAKPNALPPQQRHTAEELDAMRSKGICFKCKGRYSREHKCPLKELQILTVVNGIELEVVDGEYSDSEDDQENQKPVVCSLSLNSGLGNDSPKSIKLMGWIGKSRVLIMIDSGASHNFITPSVASKLKLQVSLDTNREILLGNGASVHSNGTCKHLQFLLSGVQFQSDFISLELGGVDIILGMQWLETLGPCLVDWKKQEWSFVYNGKQVMFVGDTSLHAPPLLLQPFEVSVKPLCLLQEQREVTLAQDIKKYYDVTERSDVGFSVGDWLYLKLQPYRLLSVVHRLNQKLAASYFGPFQAMIGDHHKVHISVPAELLGEELLVPETIMAIRLVDVGRREFLILWQHQYSSTNPRMFSTAIVSLYHTFKLEDKLIFQGGSIDMNHQAYHRKNKEKIAVACGDVAGHSDTKKLWVETEGFKYKEALGRNGGFAVYR